LDIRAQIGNAILWYLVFILSTTVHEAAHAWAAKRGGDRTAHEGGQVSLNPAPHIRRAPFGMVVIPLISVFLIGWPFGFAGTPYDPEWAHQHPRRASWMALAGPAANLLMVLVCVAVVQLGILGGAFLEPHSIGLTHMVDARASGVVAGLALFLSMMFTLNLILLVLNLLPVPPLDGASVLGLLLPDKSARAYRRVIANPVFGFLGLLLAWQVFNPVFSIVFPRVMSLVYWGTAWR